MTTKLWHIAAVLLGCVATLVNVCESLAAEDDAARVANPSGAKAGAASRATTPNIIVILADDQGYADLGVQGQVHDIRTPHLDALAAGGVRFAAGYITAPQCSPSRAGLLTGRYQQRFGFDTIPDCPLPLEEVTLAERLRDAGYVTGMVGKWHLDPNYTSQKWIAANLPDAQLKPGERTEIPEWARLAYAPAAQGFDAFFEGELNQYWANYDLDGRALKPEGEWVTTTGRYRIDVKTDAALAFIARNRARPFFLYLAYMAPHTPLDAPKAYLDRFPGEMPTRRRYALAMLSAIDDGVGRITARLRELGIEENTLVFYTSDNGAPIHNHRDSPVHTDMGGWDGSLNDPWVGEKGMLSEGGIRIPFLAQWKGTLPAGAVYEHPVISLDIAATVLAAAGIARDTALDGVDLLPFLLGETQGAPHEALFWRFWNQAAVRMGDWKYLRVGSVAEYLFDLRSDVHETVNLLDAHPEQAEKLRAQLAVWAAELDPPGLPSASENFQERGWYQQYFGLQTDASTK